MLPAVGMTAAAAAVAAAAGGVAMAAAEATAGRTGAADGGTMTARTGTGLRNALVGVDLMRTCTTSVTLIFFLPCLQRRGWTAVSST